MNSKQIKKTSYIPFDMNIIPCIPLNSQNRFGVKTDYYKKNTICKNFQIPVIDTRRNKHKKTDLVIGNAIKPQNYKEPSNEFKFGISTRFSNR